MGCLNFVREQQAYSHFVLSMTDLHGRAHICQPLVKATLTRGLPPALADDLDTIRNYTQGYELQSPSFIATARGAMLDRLAETALLLERAPTTPEVLGLTRNDYSNFADFPHSLSEARRYLSLCAVKVRDFTYNNPCGLLPAQDVAAQANRQIGYIYPKYRPALPVQRRLPGPKPAN